MITLNANKRFARSCVKRGQFLIYTNNDKAELTLMYVVKDEKIFLTASSFAKVAIGRNVLTSNPYTVAAAMIAKRLLMYEKPDAFTIENRIFLIDMHAALPVLLNSYMLSDEEKERINTFWLEAINTFRINAAGEISRKNSTKQVKPVKETPSDDDALTAKVMAVIKAMKKQGVL